MKRKKIMLLFVWVTILLNSIFMLLQREQFVSIVLLFLCGGLLTSLFVIQGKQTISYSIKRACGFSFDIGVLYLVITTVEKLIDVLRWL